MSSLINWLNHKYAPLLLMIVVLSVTYRTALLYEYGYNDDYHFITRAQTGKLLPFHNEMYEDGRPIMSTLYSGAFRLTQTVADLLWLRLLCLVALWCFAIYLYRLLLPLITPAKALLATLAVCASPPVGVLVGWAAGGLANWLATLLAILAGDIWQRGWSKKRWFLVAPASLILLIAICSYQPSTACFFLPMLLRYWDSKIDKSSLWAIPASAVNFIVVGAFYYALVRFVMVDEGHRLRLALEIEEKIQLLFAKMLLPSLESWAVFYSPAIALTVAVLFGVLMIMGLWFRSKPKRLTKLGIHFVWIALLVGATLGPSLISARGYPVYRSQFGLYIATSLLLVFGLFHAAEYFKSRSPKLLNTVNASTAGLVLLLLILSGYHLYDGIVLPNHREYTRVRRALFERIDQVPEAMVYYRPPHILSSDGLHGLAFEYGILTSPNEHTTRAFLENMFRERFLLNAPLEERANIQESIDNLKIYTQPSPGKDLPIIDGFRHMVGEPIETVNDPYWGMVRVYRNGFMENDWLGRFDNTHFPFVFHDSLGWMHCSKADQNGDFILNILNFDPIQTNPSSFPEAVNLKTGDTILLNFEVSPQRWYYNFTTEEHFFVRNNYWRID